MPRVDDAVVFLLDVDVETGTFDPPALCGFDPLDLRLHPSDRTNPPGGPVVSAAGGGDLAALCAVVHRSIEYQSGVAGIRTTAAEALAGAGGACVRTMPISCWRPVT